MGFRCRVVRQRSSRTTCPRAWDLSLRRIRNVALALADRGLGAHRTAASKVGATIASAISGLGRPSRKPRRAHGQRRPSERPIGLMPPYCMARRWRSRPTLVVRSSRRRADQLVGQSARPGAGDAVVAIGDGRRSATGSWPLEESEGWQDPFWAGSDFRIRHSA